MGCEVLFRVDRRLRWGVGSTSASGVLVQRTDHLSWLGANLTAYCVLSGVNPEALRMKNCSSMPMTMWKRESRHAQVHYTKIFSFSSPLEFLKTCSNFLRALTSHHTR